MGYTIKTWIQNGTSIRPDWTDRLAICRYYSSNDSIATPITISAVATAAPLIDALSPASYSVEAVFVCPEYFVVRDDAGTPLSLGDALATNFTAYQAGSYGFDARNDGVSIDIDIYFGKNLGGQLAAFDYNTGVYTVRNESGIVTDLTFPNVGSYKGYIEYEKNKIVSQSDTVVIAALDEIGIDLSAVNTDFMLNNAECRVYVREIGAYSIGYQDFAVDPYHYKVRGYSDFTADEWIRKSDIVSVNKVIRPRRVVNGSVIPETYAIRINLKNGIDFDLDMAEVDNQRGWTNDYAGLTAAANDINSWLL